MANSSAHVKDGFDSAYVTALALKKAYELNSAILERLLWECEGMLHATELGLSMPFRSNDDFFAGASLKGIVLKHLNSKQTFFYKEKTRILEKAKDKTGIDYSDMPTVDAYTAYVRDTCMVKLSCAVLWLHKRKIPLLREAQGVIRSDIDAIIAAYINSLHLRDDVAEKITQWEDLLTQLRGRENKAAQIAIKKWQDKPHIQAYNEVQTGSATEKSKKNYVSRAKKVAEELARNHGLSMPPWNTAE